MVATLQDVTRWMRIYASGDAAPKLKTDLLAGITGPGARETYGLALFILSKTVTGSVTAYGHPGDITGFHSLSFYMPDRGWTLTAIVNQDGADPNGFLIALTDALAAAHE